MDVSFHVAGNELFRPVAYNCRYYCQRLQGDEKGILGGEKEVDPSKRQRGQFEIAEPHSEPRSGYAARIA